MPGLVRAEGEEDFDGKLENYDDLTIGQIMRLAASTDDKGREKMARREERGKNRQPVVDILRVNWNS